MASVSFANIQYFDKLDLGILQDDRIKKCELLKNPMEHRVLKNIWEIT